MNRVKKITFKKDWRCYKAGWTFDPLPGINLLVGDQGCGKSTLLALLGQNNQEMIQITLENYELVETRYLDTEKHNPRIVGDLNGTHLPIHQVLSSRFGSHGETILPMVAACEQAIENILFLDEPESGLSLRSQYRVVEAIKKAEAQNCQLFVATHSKILIETQTTVFSLEHNRWMPTEEFLDAQKVPLPKPAKEPEQETEKKGLLRRKVREISRD